MNMFVQLNSINIQRVQLYSWPKYHQSGISMKTTHIFFILWPGFHRFFDGFSGIHGYFGRINWKPWVVFMKPDKKKLKPLRRHAGPSGLRSGPRAQRGAWEVSIYFFVRFHETTQGFNFSCQKYPWNHWNHQKNQWNQVTKKKNAWSRIKTCTKIQ